MQRRLVAMFVGAGELNILNKRELNNNNKRILISKPNLVLKKKKFLEMLQHLFAISEGLPMAPLEAMSYGIIVVVNTVTS